MKTTAFILSHYEERKDNINKIIDSLRTGTLSPDRIVVFNDNQDFEFYNCYSINVNADKNYPVITRFALGICEDADRILFIDDDLAVGPKTLENLVNYANKYPETLLGLEGNILNHKSDNCYTDGITVDRGNKLKDVDIIIRTYFATPLILAQCLYTRELFKEQLPKKSIDDIILCMSNKYQYSGRNIIIPVDGKSDLIELNPAGVGQCTDPEHYINRNLACQILK